MRKVSRLTFNKKIEALCGEYIMAYSTLEWGITVMICQHMSYEAFNPIIYLVNRAGTDVKLKLYLEIIKEFKYLSIEECKALEKMINSATQVRNYFAHAMLMLPDLDDYRNCNVIEFWTTGKLFSDEIKIVKYDLRKHHLHLQHMESIVNFNTIFSESK